MGGKHDYVSQHNFQRWQRKFIIDLCRTVAFKLPLVTQTLNIHNTNSNNDIISFFLCSPWTSEMNLVGQANGKIISRNSGKFPKIQDFLELVQEWKIPLSRFRIRKGVKANVP